MGKSWEKKRCGGGSGEKVGRRSGEGQRETEVVDSPSDRIGSRGGRSGRFVVGSELLIPCPASAPAALAI
jgi:hypothetical protein